ncbi:MAG: IS630 family transposase [Candidatus Omnitrophota bacterium]
MGKINSEFIWCMERVLDIYEKPYNSNKPVICFDERPCQLIGDILVPIPMQPGKIQREDYHYERNGTCCVFMAVEPLAGRRIVKVSKQKTKRDYAEFMKKLAQKYCNAHKIILVQDNLNTHNPSSFYETFSADEAFALSQRFEMNYTPKKASWLNMAEIELSVLSKQCLDRRIGDQQTLSAEVVPWVQRRNRQKATITWSFSKSKARNKFSRRYKSIQKFI